MAGSTSSGDTGCGHGNLESAIVPASNRPARVVLGWQAAATAAIALVAAYLVGAQGALSAALGGAISMIASLVFIAMTRGRQVRSAERVLLTALRAEGAKVVSIIVLLWLVLSWYTQIVTVAFFTAFAVSVIVSSLAFFVRER
jgi:F0F1-type ATP synthase assembly protein I